MRDRCTENQGIPLPSLVAQLRAGCETVARLQGGSAHYHEQCAIFRDFARTEGFLLSQAPSELSTAPDEEGNEHQVWFRPADASFLKATWPGFFGLLVVHRHDEEPAASPAQAGTPSASTEISPTLIRRGNSSPQIPIGAISSSCRMDCSPPSISASNPSPTPSSPSSKI
ncbi:MAG: hypothetical protein H7A51_06210 [Akkermansiaceae bacterium]|nr:hypothetical protein [Akkermansiaceae bacterium]